MASFGLTLLEAAATGLPIVATNDGGPRDIIANCQNGLLVDPLDPEAIEKSLLRMLTEPKQWDDWSEKGAAGAKKHYSWANHAKRRFIQVCMVNSQSTTSMSRHEHQYLYIIVNS